MVDWYDRFIAFLGPARTVVAASCPKSLRPLANCYYRNQFRPMARSAFTKAAQSPNLSVSSTALRVPHLQRNTGPRASSRSEAHQSFQGSIHLRVTTTQPGGMTPEVFWRVLEGFRASFPRWRPRRFYRDYIQRLYTAGISVGPRTGTTVYALGARFNYG